MKAARPKTTTLYVRGMPRDAVREAKARAARRGTTLAKVLTDALSLSLEPEWTPDADLADAMRWYAENRARLRRDYAGEYVAIVADRVLDHDKDFSALAERVFHAIGERSVYMPIVGAEERVVRFRSPRIAT